jgi:hypothetical protein
VVVVDGGGSVRVPGGILGAWMAVTHLEVLVLV